MVDFMAVKMVCVMAEGCEIGEQRERIEQDHLQFIIKARNKCGSCWSWWWKIGVIALAIRGLPWDFDRKEREEEEYLAAWRGSGWDEREKREKLNILMGLGKNRGIVGGKG